MLRGSIKNYILSRRSSGKRGCFMWDELGLGAYLNWAFAGDYMLVASGEKGISGVAVAYPLATPCDMTVNSLLPRDTEATDESASDLCVLDWIADSRSARIELVSQFKQRFPNWMRQRKFGIHYGRVKSLSNNYINKLSSI